MLFYRQENIENKKAIISLRLHNTSTIMKQFGYTRINSDYLKYFSNPLLHTYIYKARSVAYDYKQF